MDRRPLPSVSRDICALRASAASELEAKAWGSRGDEGQTRRTAQRTSSSKAGKIKDEGDALLMASVRSGPVATPPVNISWLGLVKMGTGHSSRGREAPWSLLPCKDSAARCGNRAFGRAVTMPVAISGFESAAQKSRSPEAPGDDWEAPESDADRAFDVPDRRLDGRVCSSGCEGADRESGFLGTGRLTCLESNTAGVEILNV
ncbi:hypothetical protein HYQ46_003688 [Verticillium longisporum]|nr:hypothetical protein HYQ46_003688 [Verticillium longisporum]